MGEPGIMEGGERKFGGLDIGEDPDDRVVSLKPRPWLNPVFIAFVFHGELLSRVSPAPPWSERIVARRASQGRHRLHRCVAKSRQKLQWVCHCSTHHANDFAAPKLVA
jgi:hypothetical protein